MQLTILCADTVMMGRFDASMVPEQQMLELFFTPNDQEDARTELGGDADDGCTWNGVLCSATGAIEKIEWFPWEANLSGSIDFQRMPTKLKHFTVYNQALTGEIDATSLPESLTDLCLAICAFSGTIDLGHLPRGMVAFETFDNQVTSIQNVRNLPIGLERLNIRELHATEKTISIGALPDSELAPDFSGCGFQKVDCENPDDVPRVNIEEEAQDSM